jgi:uncharacterized RDD family membrane protein YckC
MDAPPLPPPPEQPPAPGWGPPPPVTTPTVDYASFWQRFAALLIDGLIFLPFTVPFFVHVWNVTSRPAGPSGMSFNFDMTRVGDVFGWALLLGLLRYGYEAVMIANWNATVGKFALGIRVRRDDGSPAQWREALLRPLLQFGLNAVNGAGGIGLVGLLDYLWMLWDRQKQTLHDKIASTIVVRV